MKRQHLMTVIIKKVIKSVQNQSIKKQWISTSYNVLGVQHTTRVFNIACVGACNCDCMHVPFRPACLF